MTVEASLAFLAKDKTQMILARLESSPTSAKYTMNVCGRVEGVDAVEAVGV
jgi:hypothetical protein